MYTSCGIYSRDRLCVRHRTGAFSQYTQKHSERYGARTEKQTAARCKRNSRLIVLVVRLANFGLLYILKYWNFTAELLQPLASRISESAQVPTISLLMPLGVSFFMFQSVGYVIDVSPSESTSLKGIS